MMSKVICADHLTRKLFSVIEEVFETHDGIFLDPATSMLQTLDGIPAPQASLPVGGRCASLAARVAHVSFYFFEVLESVFLRGRTRGLIGVMSGTRRKPSHRRNAPG